MVRLRLTTGWGPESALYPCRIMDVKRIFRGPILYIVIAVIVVWVGSSLLTGSGFRQVTTQQGLDLLKGDNVQAVKIVDGENRVDITLQRADQELGKQVQFYYVTPRGLDIVAAVDASSPSDGYDDEVPQPNWFLSA